MYSIVVRGLACYNSRLGYYNNNYNCISVAVALLEDVLILMINIKWRISRHYLNNGYILYIMFTDIVFIEYDFEVVEKP